MTTKRLRTLETPTGKGKVVKDGVPIADVTYTLLVKQEYLISKSLTGEEELPGQKEISGQIRVIAGERDLMDGSILTLQLADDRQWQFFARSGDPVSGQYSAVNVNPEGLLPK
jgi:hypothetical protein